MLFSQHLYPRLNTNFATTADCVCASLILLQIVRAVGFRRSHWQKLIYQGLVHPALPHHRDHEAWFRNIPSKLQHSVSSFNDHFRSVKINHHKLRNASQNLICQFSSQLLSLIVCDYVLEMSSRSTSCPGSWMYLPMLPHFVSCLERVS